MYIFLEPPPAATLLHNHLDKYKSDAYLLIIIIIIIIKFKRKIAKTKGKAMTKSGRKRKFRKSGINILGLAIFILSIIGVFTKL